MHAPMTDRHALPAGMTPRLLSRKAAAAYCGMVGETFDKHVRPHVPPVKIETGRKLWDVRALDQWLDQLSGLINVVRPTGSWAERLGR
jgi:hypothetical protein